MPFGLWWMYPLPPGKIIEVYPGHWEWVNDLPDVRDIERFDSESPRSGAVPDGE